MIFPLTEEDKARYIAAEPHSKVYISTIKQSVKKTDEKGIEERLNSNGGFLEIEMSFEEWFGV